MSPHAADPCTLRRDTLRMIVANMDADARHFDFTERAVAEYFGRQGAAIAALALLIETLLPKEEEPS